jgi:tyrosine-protein phosphatase SIW14
MKKEGIRHIVMPLSPNKDAVNVTDEQIAKILETIVDPVNLPVLVHCNQGKHRTGCVIGALRRSQGWHLENALLEYQHFAGTKVRKFDQEFIKKFDTSLAEDYINILNYPHPSSDGYDEDDGIVFVASAPLFSNYTV